MAYPQSCLLRRSFARPTHSSRDRNTYGGCAEGLCIFNCLGEGLLRTGKFPSALLAFAAARYLDCRSRAVIAVAPIGGRPPCGFDMPGFITGGFVTAGG